jgi:hypothetical protein
VYSVGKVMEISMAPVIPPISKGLEAEAYKVIPIRALRKGEIFLSPGDAV